MDIPSALVSAAEVLKEAGVADPRREAASLLTLTLDKPNTFLIAHPEYELTADENHRFDEFMVRRANREPFQYIAGKQEFYGLDFEVTPAVLIPRPETEILVEEAIKELAKLENPRFCEIGVGSGCISVSILANIPNATAVATDISDDAIAVAQRNAERHGVADRLVLKPGDLFAGIDQKFDMIVSNPPYISEAELTDMQPEVRDFEPQNALFAGSDGMDIIRLIIDAAPEHLNPGLLLMEVGFGQELPVRKIIERGTWHGTEFLKDLQGIGRTLKTIRRVTLQLGQ